MANGAEDTDWFMGSLSDIKYETSIKTGCSVYFVHKTNVFGNIDILISYTKTDYIR